MSQSLSEIRARLRAADLALAQAGGGSSELARVREATGSLLVAVYGLVEAVEATEAGEPPQTPEAPAPLRAKAVRK